MGPDRQRADEPKRHRDWDKANLSPERDFVRPVVGDVSRRSSGRADSSVDLSVIEIAVMWILHHKTQSLSSRGSLTQAILDFCPVALSAIARSLRGAKSSDLRLIYFKGLIIAQTHPRQQMIDAIKRAEYALEHHDLANWPCAPALVPSIPRRPEDRDTLAHIADALGQPSDSSH